MTKISDLTAAATLTTAGLLPVVQDISSTLETRKVTLATLAAFTSTQAGNGSAATPGIAFASDPDTGLYRSGANAIGLATGGTARAHDRLVEDRSRPKQHRGCFSPWDRRQHLDLARRWNQ